MYSNIKFRENMSSGSRVVPYGRTDRQKDIMTKLIAAFHSFVNVPKMVPDKPSVSSEGSAADGKNVLLTRVRNGKDKEPAVLRKTTVTASTNQEENPGTIMSLSCELVSWERNYGRLF
jgi:hypothetical protein